MHMLGLLAHKLFQTEAALSILLTEARWHLAPCFHWLATFIDIDGSTYHPSKYRHNQGVNLSSVIFIIFSFRARHGPRIRFIITIREELLLRRTDNTVTDDDDDQARAECRRTTVGYSLSGTVHRLPGPSY